MKIVFDSRFNGKYAEDNAAMPGRMEAAMSGLEQGPWEIIAPSPVGREVLRLSHSEAYIQTVMEDGPRFATACLAAGGAILAARLGCGGDPAFACIRPPGHHATHDSAWGHCTFNNMVIALHAMRAEKRIESAFVLDIDAHTGDGTRQMLASWPLAEVFNPYAEDGKSYLELVASRLAELRGAHILAVSAGFDGYTLDVGHKLDTSDFEQLGSLVRRASERLCRGRRFALLEGGYYLKDLGTNVLAFCRGFAG